eukprot:GILK01001068.1.p1 GENE.GILK01001068.1~~GILK01001068.1.p1  ORF type:complete len:379 (+),score=57.04 GILK01001068.1:45-1139(+)
MSSNSIARKRQLCAQAALHREQKDQPEHNDNSEALHAAAPAVASAPKKKAPQPVVEVKAPKTSAASVAKPPSAAVAEAKPPKAPVSASVAAKTKPAKVPPVAAVLSTAPSQPSAAMAPAPASAPPKREVVGKGDDMYGEDDFSDDGEEIQSVQQDEEPRGRRLSQPDASIKNGVLSRAVRAASSEPRVKNFFESKPTASIKKSSGAALSKSNIKGVTHSKLENTTAAYRAQHDLVTAGHSGGSGPRIAGFSTLNTVNNNSNNLSRPTVAPSMGSSSSSSASKKSATVATLASTKPEVPRKTNPHDEIAVPMNKGAKRGMGILAMLQDACQSNVMGNLKTKTRNDQVLEAHRHQFEDGTYSKVAF